MLLIMIASIIGIVVTLSFIGVDVFPSRRGRGRAYLRSRRRPSRRVLHLMLGLSLASLLFVIGWFLLDDSLTFMLYLQHDDPETEEYSGSHSWSDPRSWGGPGGGGSTNGRPGMTGINSMYLGVLTGSYYGEYLSILMNTSNSSLIPTEFFNNNKSYMPNGRNSWRQVPVYYNIGINIVETGTNSDGIGPSQFLDVKSYQPGTDYTLYRYNTALVLAGANVDNGFGKDGYRSTGMCGPLQFSNQWFDIFPVVKASWSPNNAKFWPSILNGYGQADGVQRKGRSTGGARDGELDSFYFPDIIVASCCNAQYGMGASGNYEPNKNVSDVAFVIGAASNHYYGGVTTRYCLGVSDSSTVKEKMTYAEDAFEWLANIFIGARDFAFEHGDEVGVSWYSGSTWQGWAFMLIEMNGGFAYDNTARTEMLNALRNETAFRNGALLAYKYAKGVDASSEDMINYMSSHLRVQNAGEMNYAGQPTRYTQVNRNLYVKNPTSSASGQAVYSCWDAMTVKEAANAVIMGPYVYQKVLALCGVEATVRDCYNDIYGSLITRIPGGSWTGEGYAPSSVNLPANSYYWGTRPFVSFVPNSPSLVSQTSVMYWRYLSNSQGIHFGEDFGYGAGQTIASVCAGSVVTSAWDDGWGNYVQVEAARAGSEPKIMFTYAHQQSKVAKKGDQLKEGDTIGYCGTTGNSTGYHLHLEMWVYNEFNNTTVRSCMSFGSVFKGLYTPATGPRVQKISSGAKTNKTACIVYSGVGENLGLLSVVNKTEHPEACVTSPLESVGLNFFMIQALESWALAKGGPSATGAVATNVTSYTPETPSAPVSSITADQINKLIAFCEAEIGVPYVSGGTSHSGFDCSGLMYAAYKSLGIDINRTASGQRNQFAVVPLSDVKRGDFVFWHKRSINYAVHKQGDPQDDGTAHHVGMVVAVNNMTPDGLIIIDSNVYGNGTRNGVVEAAISAQTTKNVTEDPNGLYWTRTDSSGMVHFYTFGRFIG